MRKKARNKRGLGQWLKEMDDGRTVPQELTRRCSRCVSISAAESKLLLVLMPRPSTLSRLAEESH